MPDQRPTRCGLWINGEQDCRREREYTTVTDPYHGCPVADVEHASSEDVTRAVAAARYAFQTQWGKPGHARAGWLHAAAQAVEEHSEQLTETLVRTLGKPRRAAAGEVTRGAAVFRLAAEEIVRFGGETIPVDGVAGGEDRWSLTFHEPHGVAALVTPFNAPVNLLAQKLAPALAVGNAAVVKPSPEAGPVTNQLASVLTGSLPEGMVNVIHGGAEVVLDLVSRPEVDVVSLTGGVEAGRSVLARAGVKPVFLELGSNSPNIVASDADLADAATRIAAAAFGASGQQCISAQRVFVQTNVFDSFADQITAAARRLIVGDPADPETVVGPVVHDRATERIQGMVRDAEERGAKVLLDGRPAGDSNPRLVGPTLLSDVPDGAAVLNEEVFGPVAVLARVHTFEEAITASNQVGGMLQAACFTRDLSAATRAARQIRAGSVWINEPTRFRLDVYPFGGTGTSGVGREGIRYAMEAFSHTKHVGIRPL